jgi:hypothetical protein
MAAAVAVTGAAVPFLVTRVTEAAAAGDPCRSGSLFWLRPADFQRLGDFFLNKQRSKIN